MEITLTLNNLTPEKALAILSAYNGEGSVTLSGMGKTPMTLPVKAKTTKKTKAPEQMEMGTEEIDELAAASDDAEETFEEFEELEEKAPAKKAPAKITEKMVHSAAHAHAEANGKKATVAILQKFKVKSILELKPEQYAKVLQALAI